MTSPASLLKGEMFVEEELELVPDEHADEEDDGEEEGTCSDFGTTNADEDELDDELDPAARTQRGSSFRSQSRLLS
jgi:hypothetical protein